MDALLLCVTLSPVFSIAIVEEQRCSSLATTTTEKTKKGEDRNLVTSPVLDSTFIVLFAFREGGNTEELGIALHTRGSGSVRV